MHGSTPPNLQTSQLHDTAAIYYIINQSSTPSPKAAAVGKIQLAEVPKKKYDYTLLEFHAISKCFRACSSSIFRNFFSGFKVLGNFMPFSSLKFRKLKFLRDNYFLGHFVSNKTCFKGKVKVKSIVFIQVQICIQIASNC